MARRASTGEGKAVSAARAPLHRNKWVHLTLGLAVSLGCLWWAAGELLGTPEDRQSVQDAFARANYFTLLPMWIGVAAFYWLKAWRWRLLLKPVGDFHTVRDLLPYVMIGFAANNLAPARVGELMRVYLFARRARVPLASVFSTVVLERVLDALTILTILGTGLAFVPGVDPAVRSGALVLAAIVAALVAAALAYVFWTGPFVVFVEAVLARVPFLPARLRIKLTTTLEAGAAGLAALKKPRLLVGIFATSLAQWLINGALMYVALLSFGVHVDPLVAGIVQGVTAIAVAVPSSPGYIGVIQAAFMMVLKLFTDDRANVLAASVYYHLVQYIPVTLVGVYYLFKTTGLKFAEVEAAAETETDLSTGEPGASATGVLPGGTDAASVGSTPPKSQASMSTPADSVTRTE
jgi:hypothetical protein